MFELGFPVPEFACEGSQSCQGGLIYGVGTSGPDPEEQLMG